MASLAQLEAEPYWSREIVTSPMVGLGLQLRTAYGTGPGSVGVKGNVAHLSGGHRSQEWLKKSAYAEDRSYATQSGLAGTQLLVCSALDFVPGEWGSADNRDKMRVLTRRVIDAMKAGRIDELLEVFGTLDGRTVAGWRNDLNRSSSSDPSHLDHLHLRFDRRYANDNAVMSRMAAILLEDDMPLTQADAELVARAVHNQILGRSTITIGTALQNIDARTGALVALLPADLVARFDAILAAALDDDDVTVTMPPDAIQDLTDIKAAIAALPAAVADEEHARLAD